MTTLAYIFASVALLFLVWQAVEATIFFITNFRK